MSRVESRVERAEKKMKKKILSVALATIALAAVHLAEAQQGKIYRIGVLAQPEKLRNASK